ncbi:cell division protein ZapA [Alicyclobacillus sp. SP_1]|uniref:cell division protein ZapA n=1 Tax=Alicyclobacillus sp. SP_1 TaxID=2942475 RepID=UPI002158787D|nr:cell division protein ZapA [Alicyclobacillus sp. SP_1]
MNRIKVQIHGAEYTLRGDASSQHLRAVAERVDHLMAGITSAVPHLDERRAAVLSAVNMADELLRLEQSYEALQREYQELLELIEEQTGKKGPSSS